MNRNAVLDLIPAVVLSLLGCEGQGNLGCSGHELLTSRFCEEGEGKNKSQDPGLEMNRLCPFWESFKESQSKTRGKSSARKLVNIQELPPPSSVNGARDLVT